MDRPMRRRRFLLRTLAAAAGCVPLAYGEANSGWAAEAGAAQRPAMLTPDAQQQWYRVRIEMTVQGNVDLPKNALVSKDRAAQLPIDSRSVLDYEERQFRDAAGQPRAADRYFHEANSEGKIGSSQRRIELRPAARRVAVQHAEGRALHYGLQEYLTHDELDLLRVPTSSLAADQLLPATEVSVGDTYAVDGDALCRLLDLAAVQKADVTGRVVQIDEKTAKLQLQGSVEGSIEGVPTTIDLAGKVTFDRTAGTCVWVALAIREMRTIGKAEPGFQVAATIKMIRQPLGAGDAIGKPAPLQVDQPAPPDRLLVELRSPQVGFATLMDRRWRMFAQTPGLVTMRMIDSDRDIAQCDIRPLASLKPGEQLTLEGLQRDIRRTLGDRYREFLQAEESANSAGLRVVRVAVAGAVEGVPVQWVFNHFSDDQGRRLLATFTMAAEKAEAFAGSDIQLAGSLRLLEQPPAAGELRAADGQNPPVEQAQRLNASPAPAYNTYK